MQKDEELLIALRKVNRAIDIRSKQLSKEVGLTGPQLLVMRELGKSPGIMVREVASFINLSPATVTSILDRLETKHLIQRIRCTEDKRKVGVYLTDDGVISLNKAPMHFQDHFLNRFSRLEIWEQSQMVATLQRLACMMDAQELDAAPVLELGAINPE